MGTVVASPFQGISGVITPRVSSNIRIASDKSFQISSTTEPTGTPDISVKRDAVGRASIGDGGAALGRLLVHAGTTGSKGIAIGTVSSGFHREDPAGEAYIVGGASGLDSLAISRGAGAKAELSASKGYRFSTSAVSPTSGEGPRFCGGAGDPEGVHVAPIGTLYVRTDGGAVTTLYVKESGVGNTGWVAK